MGENVIRDDKKSRRDRQREAVTILSHSSLSCSPYVCMHLSCNIRILLFVGT